MTPQKRWPDESSPGKSDSAYVFDSIGNGYECALFRDLAGHGSGCVRACMLAAAAGAERRGAVGDLAERIRAAGNTARDSSFRRTRNGKGRGKLRARSTGFALEPGDRGGLAWAFAMEDRATDCGRHSPPWHGKAGGANRHECGFAGSASRRPFGRTLCFE